MKVTFKGETKFLMLTHHKIYTVISIEQDWYRIVDHSGEDYLYPPELFDIVKDTAATVFCEPPENASLERLDGAVLPSK